MVERGDLIKRAWRHQCPNCGAGKEYLFKDNRQIEEECRACGLRLWQDGFYLGAWVINYGVVVFGVVCPLLLVGAALGWWGLWFWLALAAISLGMPYWFYQRSWLWWFASYYFFLLHELPANSPDQSEKKDAS